MQEKIIQKLSQNSSKNIISHIFICIQFHKSINVNLNKL